MKLKQPESSPDSPMKRRKKWSAGRITAWVVMIAFIALSIFPFYWMLRTALSTTRSLPSDPSSLLPVVLLQGTNMAG